MQLRDFALQVLCSTSLNDKLASPATELIDTAPGPALWVEQPGRPQTLLFAPRRTAPGLPSAKSLIHPQKRGVAHHILANHELQALEVMARILLAFPQAPREFRLGLARIMRDEQHHTVMHCKRAAKLGVPFGSLPVNDYIWKKSLMFRDLLDYLAGLPLVFEGANLDHSLELEAAFLAVEDRRSAAIMRRIHLDEIEHVRFGIEWLRSLKPSSQSDWEVFESHLHWPLRPSKARGTTFQREARLQAGLSPDFIEQLIKAIDEPDREPRTDS